MSSHSTGRLTDHNRKIATNSQNNTVYTQTPSYGTAAAVVVVVE